MRVETVSSVRQSVRSSYTMWTSSIKCTTWSLLIATILSTCQADSILSIPLKRVENGIVASVGVGTPPQNLDILIDTSTTTVWAYSQHCSSWSIACWNHNRFDGAKSKSYKTENQPVTLEDESQGIISIDNFTLGSTNLRLPFVELLKRSGVWTGEGEYFDGIMGVGLPYDFSSTRLPPPFYYKLLAATPHKMFSLYFGKDKSMLDLGGINYSLIKPETIAFTSVIIDNCWTIAVDKILIGDNVVCEGDCEARLDTASDGIMGPDAQIKAIREKTRHSETDGYFSCSKLAQLPPLKFVIGGKVFPLQASDYAIKHNFGLCSDGLTDLGNQERYWILGNNFITKFYTAFDLTNKQVAFALHKGS